MSNLESTEFVQRPAGVVASGDGDAVRTVWHAAAAMWRLWRTRQAERRALAAIDERDLHDAGISPLMAQYEAQQPFWRPLHDLRE